MSAAPQQVRPHKPDVDLLDDIEKFLHEVARNLGHPIHGPYPNELAVRAQDLLMRDWRALS